jgi:hypothetical protein
MDLNNQNLKGIEYYKRQMNDEYGEFNRMNFENKTKIPMSYYFPEGKRDQFDNNFSYMNNPHMYNQDSFNPDYIVK